VTTGDSTRILLIRHAKAGSRERWEGDDRQRALTRSGRRQAEALVEQLRDEPIERVLSSPYLRCIQTVEPLAGARSLMVKTERLLAEGADWRQTLDLVSDAPGPAVMSSQGDVIGGIVMSLVEQGLVEAENARWQKGSTWVLEVRERRIIGATYLPPLEA
jgi:phosphohistidine phosphatase SixA